MGYFYGYRIAHNVINPKTNEPWKLEDVPEKYKPVTIQWIEEHVNPAVE